MRKIFAAALAVLTLTLAACGGGGGGSSTASPAAVVVTPVPVVVATTSAAQLSVPPASYTSADALAAFNYLNSIRATAGLGLMAQNTKLDTAAQAHINWMVTNRASAHFETAGTPGFTGVDPGDRETAAGYQFNSQWGWSEEIGYGASAMGCIDGLMASIYHRGAMLGGFHEVGFGTVQTGALYSLTADMGTASGILPQSNVQGVAIWPADGSKGVPLIHANEIPYPVPELGAWCSPTCPGYPVSVHLDDLTSSVTSFAITDSTGAAVAVKAIQQDAGNRMFALVPLAKLKPNTTYTVQFTGTANGKPTSKTWSFTTAAS